MAVIGRRDGLAPRAHPGGPHGAGSWWPWRALLLAWLSLGCGIGTTQVPAPGEAMWGPEPPSRTRPRRQSAHGAWGSWGPWSACSSSCGDGVALRTRRCLRSADEEPCIGDQRQYRLCQLQGCPGGSVLFRAMQCSLYDDTPVQGMQTRHRWVPFYGGEPQGVGAPSGALMPPTTGVPSFPLALQPPTSVTSTAWLWGTTSTTPLAACWTAPAAGPAPRICASVGAA